MGKLSRNDLCWCGSGKKFKVCHMEQDNVINDLVRQGYTLPTKSIIKTKEQIEGIKKSAELTKEIFAMLEGRIEAGITTEQIDQWVYQYTIEHGGYPATLNYYGYPKSICTSINDVICHGIPDDTILKEGDIINVDITTILNQYYSDASRMYAIGKVSDTANKLVQCAKECLYIGIEQVKPYAPTNLIGAAIEKHAKKNGFSVVRDYGGHGVGIDIHEDPFIYHFDTKQKGMIMVPGMVFTIEPMINEGKYHSKVLADDWTAVTVDGSLSAQWEHTILVTESGAEILI